MLQNIITKPKQDKKNMKKEHQMSDDRQLIVTIRIIIVLRISPHTLCIVNVHKLTFVDIVIVIFLGARASLELTPSLCVCVCGCLSV